MSEKKVVVAIVALCIAGLVAWMFFEMKPKPGQILEDQGRGHVPIGTDVQYSSNPPTSGPHYEQWIKWGVFDAPRDDRNLVHSLEHGYVIMSYNCDFQKQSFKLIPEVKAQGLTGQMTAATESAEATNTAQLSDNFHSASCQELKNQLQQIFDSKGQVRLIVVPRPNLDAMVAVSAWRYMDKMDEFDKKRIEGFIDAHINQGPEKTIE